MKLEGKSQNSLRANCTWSFLHPHKKNLQIIFVLKGFSKKDSNFWASKLSILVLLCKDKDMSNLRVITHPLDAEKFSSSFPNFKR